MISKKRNARRRWSTSDVAQLHARYPDTPTRELARSLGYTEEQVYRKAAKLGLRKSAAYLAGPHAFRLRRGDHVGAATRFKKGQKPWNTGMKGLQIGGRSAEARFKPGSLPHNYKPVGAERISKEGYLQRKMTDTGYPPRDWVPVHHLVWIAHHGPIPKSHIVAFRDGNKQNITIENLELISRVENMRRNTVHNLPKELVTVIQLKGAVQRQINKRQKP